MTFHILASLTSFAMFVRAFGIIFVAIGTLLCIIVGAFFAVHYFVQYASWTYARTKWLEVREG